MVLLDIILGLLLAYGLFKGLKNGLLLELASVIALVAGIYGAIHFSYVAGDFLGERLEWDPRYIKIAALIITFCAIVLAVHLLGKFLTRIADFAMLGIVNTIAGGAFGLLKAGVILAALLIFFDHLNANMGLVDDATLENSELYPLIRNFGYLVFHWVVERPSP